MNHIDLFPRSQRESLDSETHLKLTSYSVALGFPPGPAAGEAHAVASQKKNGSTHGEGSRAKPALFCKVATNWEFNA